MKFKQPQTLEQIAGLLNIEFVGESGFPITGINEIHVVEKGDIVFVDHPKYYDKALNSAATTILINKKVDCPEGKSLLISDDPFRDFNKITKHFNPFIASKSSIAESAIIGEETVIQPNVFIGENVRIGKNCLIHANVSINNNCIIGDNVTIHANTVLGADAFYYKNRPEGFEKLISGGRVVLEDNVDLGASCTIDRGV
ncbi:UDP-3-O-(3-hydroxymyristoyl)glucosamine N-acyltransferase, partial [Rhodobacteraceae bacterium 4F10]